MATSLKAGEKAPNFKAKDQNGNTVSLGDFKGKWLAIYFYPEDDTPTCTIQACNLRDNFAALKAADIAVVGISPQGVVSHKKFEEKLSLPFTLLADENHAIIDKYGVWGPKQMFAHKYMGLYRTTFLVDDKGIIQKIFLKPKNKDHAAEIIKAKQTVEGY